MRNSAFAAHLGETSRLVLDRAAETIFPPSILAVTFLGLIASIPGAPLVEGLPFASWLAAGFAAAAAALGAFRSLLRLMEDLEERGILQEALASPMGGISLALAWLLPATGAGFAAGFLVLGLGGRLTGLPWRPASAAPLLLTAAFFSGLALPAWLLLPPRWRTPFRLYALPLLVLAGAFAPAFAWSPFSRTLVLFDPVFQGAAALRGVLGEPVGGIHPLWYLAVLFALSAGFWTFSLDLCRRGLGLRTR